MTFTPLGREDFEKLLEFRVTLRRFQRWSEDQARMAGLTHVQHQLLVAIKGHPGDRPPAIGDLAGYLLLRPHSTAELVDRAAGAGLVERIPDSGDGRVTRVRLTADGDRIMQELTQSHLERLHELAAVLDELVNHSDGAAGGGSAPSALCRDAILSCGRHCRFPDCPRGGSSEGQPGCIGVARRPGR